MTQESLLPPERALPERAVPLASPEADPSPAADPVACPYLGLMDDPRTHFSFATVGHRCHSPRGPKEIELTHQASFCLAVDYPSCRRFVDPSPEPAHGLPVRPSAAVGAVGVVASVDEVTPPETVAPLPMAPSPAKRTKPVSRATGRRRPGTRWMLPLVVILAIAVAAGWLLTQGRGVPAADPGASAANVATSPAPSRNPTLSAVGSPPATGAPGASQTDARTTPTTHTVLRYETLSRIAKLYGVTVDDIVAANGLTDPNYITIGQKLIIPAP